LPLFRHYALRGAKRNQAVAPPDHQEIEMTQDNSKGRKSVLYWITLTIIFAAFITVALS